MAKYQMTWDLRNGAGAEANEASAKRNLAVFAQWEPNDDVEFLQFLARADGQGGFAVIETDNFAAAAGEIAKFAPFFEFHLYPCLDVADGVALGAAAIAFRDSVS